MSVSGHDDVCRVCQRGTVVDYKCNSCYVTFCSVCHGICGDTQSDLVMRCYCNRGEKPEFPSYVLVSEWPGKVPHRELATITAELPLGELEEIISEGRSHAFYRFLINRLSRIALAQHGGPAGSPKLVSLYRVTSWGGVAIRPQAPDQMIPGGNWQLGMELEPVAVFDNDGNVVPVNKTSAD
ncbi:MAG: hypothetical protein V1846_01980 [Candidatus Komeilibacteria bacterium]